MASALNAPICQSDWYKALRKPRLQPPGYLFGIVWPILYLLMGVLLVLILREPDMPERTVALTIFLIQLILNISWSYTFSASHDLFFAWIHLSILLIINLWLTWSLPTLRMRLLQLPYLGWLCFANYLSFELYRSGAEKL